MGHDRHIFDLILDCSMISNIQEFSQQSTNPQCKRKRKEESSVWQHRILSNQHETLGMIRDSRHDKICLFTLVRSKMSQIMDF